DDVRAGEQRRLMLIRAGGAVAFIVGERRSEMPHGSLTLQLHVVLVAVNVEARPGSVVDAPDDDCGDLDRVAALVIDLQALAVEVPRARSEEHTSELQS